MDGMTKRFDLDIGKRRARKRLREFIKARIFNKRQVKVLCLPGGQGLEIHQVYRWLGIPDENIYGVECDPESARQIRLNYPRINLFEGTLDDFVDQYDGDPFSVVSLDYCGHLDAGPLCRLAVQHKMAERAVVAVNVFAGREDKKTQAAMRSMYARGKVQNLMAGRRLTLNEHMDEINDILQQGSSDELKEVRDDSVTYQITNIMSYYMPTAWLTAHLGLSHCEGTLINLYPGNKVSIDGGNIKVDNIDRSQIRPANEPTAVSYAIKNFAIDDVNKQLTEIGAFSYLNQCLAKRGIGVGDPWEFGRALVMAWYDKYGFPYLPVSIDRFSYISDSGKRMVSDLVEVRMFRSELEAMNDGIKLYWYKDEPDKHRFVVKLPSDFDSMESFVDYLVDIVLAYDKNIASKAITLPAQYPDREDLGGGWMIPMNEKKIKAKVVELLNKGRSVEQIAEKYPTLGVGAIRAIKAHVTMGTYDKKTTTEP